jgi:hypothetical protein
MVAKAPLCDLERVTQGDVDVLMGVVRRALPDDDAIASKVEVEADRVDLALVVVMVGGLDADAAVQDVLTKTTQLLDLLANALLDELGSLDAMVVDAK